jgi:uroporphyrinogen-III decarboxylase
MTGKETLLQAIQGKPTERPAWVPFVGCHGGKLIGKTATEYLSSPELLEQGLRKAIELYRPDGLPIMFDLQVEAEILGCELRWADEVPPAVVSHPLVNGTIADLPEFSADKGRFPLVLEAMDKLVADLGDEVAFYGLVCGPFTLALHLLGNDIFLQMFDDPEGVKEIINYCADVAIKSAQVYVDHGASVIAAVDPMTSQISPGTFRGIRDPLCQPRLRRRT